MNALCFLRWIVYAGFCAWLAAPAAAAELPRGLAEWHVEALRDPAGQAGIADVSLPAADDRFVPLPSGMLSAGYTRDSWWLRFTVRRQARAPHVWRLEVEPAYLDDLRLFSPDGHGGFVEQRLGDRLPFAARPLPYRNALFALDLPDDAPRRYYLRIQTSSAMLVMPTMQTPEAFRVRAQTSLMGLFLFYGVLLAMLAINLLYAIWLRDRFFAGYAIFLMVQLIAFFSRDGFLGQLVFPEQPLIPDGLLGFSTYATFGLAMALFRSFVKVGQHFPRLDRVVAACVVFELIVGFSVFSDYYVMLAPVGRLLLVPAGLIILIAAVKEARAGAPGAEYVAFAFFIHLVMILYASLNYVAGTASDPAAKLILASLAQLLMLQIGIIARAHHADRQRQALETSERAARERADQERRTHEAQSQFLNMVAHEVRTPLAVITASINTLRLVDGTAQPAVIERFDRIERSAQRMSALFGLCLDAERIETRQDRPEPQTVFLPTLVADMAAVLGPDFIARCTLRDETAGESLQADPQLLKVAIANLLDNAGKYSPPGSPIEAIIHSVRESKGEGRREGIALDVIDRGPGVPADMRERIFEKHFRGSGLKDTPGLGLGLYLTRRICAAHGGYVRVLEGAGGRFRIFLPKNEKTDLQT